MPSAVIRLNMKDWVSWLKKLGPKFKPAAMRGARKTALHAVALLHTATGTAPSASGAQSLGGAVNTGFYKAAWKWAMLADGAVVYNAAPYASIIERGRRAGSRMPPLSVVARWAQRRLGLSEAEARKAAYPIARAIAKRGLAPRRVLTDLLPEIERLFPIHVQEELMKELTGP